MRVQPGFAPHVMTLGKGDRRALALHCTMAFGGAWAGLSKAMPELTLVAPDMPSHGRSADWDEQSDFSDTVYAASLSAMDEGPMDVIGHSFGAVIALQLAVKHSEMVRSLTVVEPVFFAVAMTRRPEVMADHDRRIKPIFDALLVGEREIAARKFNGMWSAGGPRWGSLPERSRAAMTRSVNVTPGQHRLIYDDSAGLLQPGGLDSLDTPTLVIKGEHALPAIAAVNDGLAEIIPNARQVVIEGAGHMAPISHPAEVADALRKVILT